MKDLSNIVKEFEKIVKVPYVKKIPKHEPTSSYYHLVRCIAECMMRSDEFNRHMHVSYAKDTAPSLNINDTDKDESKEFIVHKPLSKNPSMDVRKLECNIINKTLSQTHARTHARTHALAQYGKE